MFKIDSEDGTTIRCTRGDSGSIIVTKIINDEESELFYSGDQVILSIKNNFSDDEVLLRKVVLVKEDTDHVIFDLTKEDTCFSELLASPMTYQYDISINEDITILGYDESGAKKFILYPEGGKDVSEIIDSDNDLNASIPIEKYEQIIKQNLEKIENVLKDMNDIKKKAEEGYFNGIDGQEGKSAYQIWLNLGNTGTEQDFLDSLKGDKGSPGIQGIQGEIGPQGPKGEKGIDGYTPVYGQDYMGPEDKKAIQDYCKNYIDEKYLSLLEEEY